MSIKIGIAALLLVGIAGLSACPCSADEPKETAKTDTLQRSRELVARSYDQRGMPAHIVLQPGKKPSKSFPDNLISDAGAWLARLGFGRSSTAHGRAEVEVLGRLKSGQEVVIDRISSDDLSTVPLIVDSAGSLVGYFLYSTSKEDIYASARGIFVMYFVRKQSLVHTSGEFRCKKGEREGEPKVRFSNAQWDNGGRELTFDLRSSCGVIEFFGGVPGRSLVNLTGFSGEHFRGALDTNSRPYTEEGGRIHISFGGNGEIASVDVDNAQRRSRQETNARRDARRQKMKQCRDESKEASSIRLCGPGAYWESVATWRLGDEVIDLEITCTDDVSPTIDERRDHVVGVCDTKPQSENGRVLDFAIVHQQSPRLVEFQLECACGTLVASRFHFDFYNRTISFNLKTDATAIKFEGGEFRLPTIGVEEREGRSTLPVPIFAVQFNEQWQVVGIATVTQQVPVSSSTGVADK